MIFLIIFLVLAIICPIFYFLYTRNYTEGFWLTSAAAGLLAVVFLLFSLIVFINDRTFLIEYRETQTLVDTFKDAPEVERVGIAQKKIDLNGKLAKRKARIEFCSLLHFCSNEIKELKYIQ